MTVTAHDRAHHLYAEHRHWLHNWLRRRMDNGADAADLTQDVFVRILSGPAADIHEPRAYLRKLAQHLVIDLWRSRDVEARYLEALAAEPQAHAASAEALAMVRQAIAALDRLLDGLPVAVRHAFLLNRLEGLSHPQVAARMGISLATVERHVKRALLHCYLASRP